MSHELKNNELNDVLIISDRRFNGQSSKYGIFFEDSDHNIVLCCYRPGNSRNYLIGPLFSLFYQEGGGGSGSKA